MSKTTWRNGTSEDALSADAVRTLDQIGEAMDGFVSHADSFKGSNGLIDAALWHWESCGRHLWQAINTISGQGILETFFSFQSDHVQVFVNLEGAHPEDVEVKIIPDEAGFDLNVRHREARCLVGKRQYAHRQVLRSYRFMRPLTWESAEYVVRPDGILHMIIPGPLLSLHSVPFQPITTNRSECGPCSVRPDIHCT